MKKQKIERRSMKKVSLFAFLLLFCYAVKKVKEIFAYPEETRARR